MSEILQRVASLDFRNVDLSRPVNTRHPLNRGLVAWWMPLPGISGGSLLVDLCGQYHAKIFGATWDARVGRGRVPRFVRASTQYASGPVPAINDPLTIATWFKSDDTTNSQEICMFGNASAVDFYRLNINGAAQTVRAIATDGGVSRISTSSNTWTANTWNFGAAVFASITSRTAFLNGVAATPETTAATLNVPDVIAIGRSEISGFPNYLNGWLDDTRVYNRALSTDELVALQRESQLGHPNTLNRKRRFFAIPSAGSGDISASATWTWTPTATPTGLGELVASAAWTWTPTGTATGSGDMSASASWTWTPTGTLTGFAVATSSETWTWSPTGTETGYGELAGTSAWTWTATGTLTSGAAAAATRFVIPRSTTRKRLTNAKYPDLWRSLIGAWSPEFDKTANGLIADLSMSHRYGVPQGVRVVPSAGRLAIQSAMGASNVVQITSTNPGLPDLQMASCRCWTMSAWVFPTTLSPGNYPTAMSYGRWGASLGMQDATGKIEHWRNNALNYASTGSLIANQWNHIAITNQDDGTPDLLKFYLNGELSGTASPAQVGVAQGFALCAVASGAVTTSGFPGLVDDCLVYCEALPSQTLREIVALGRGGWAEQRKLVHVVETGVAPSGDMSASASWTWTPTATATGYAVSSGSGTWDWTPTGTETGIGECSSAENWTWTPTGTLDAIGVASGSTTWTWTPSATINGLFDTTGSAALTWTPAGVIDGIAVASGSATLAWTPTGSATGIGDLSCATTWTWTPTGSTETVTIPGIEWTLQRERLHWSLPRERLHWEVIEE